MRRPKILSSPVLTLMKKKKKRQLTRWFRRQRATLLMSSTVEVSHFPLWPHRTILRWRRTILTLRHVLECGLPPEFCEWAAKGQDIDECKKWLGERHPELFEKLYVATTEGEEESKEGGGKKQKKKKKVAFAGDQDKKIRVIKLKRGGKKIVSSIFGLDAYGCDLANTAKIFSRKLGTGAASMEIEYKELKEMGVQVQGDVSDRMEEIVTTDLA